VEARDQLADLAERFDSQRAHLRAVAYRMLGSAAEADDAVQEAWLRLSRADVSEIRAVEPWLRTVVSRLCLDILRTRAARREEPLDWHAPAQAQADEPEQEALLADAVGRAMLVVLDRLSPAERVAFVLHDLFAVPFDQISPVVGRTVVATKKLASRARRRVRGAPVPADSAPGAEVVRQRQVVEAFLAAARSGDVGALLAVLAPDVVRHADPAVLQPGGQELIRGADTVARQTLVLGPRARFAQPALVNGAVGAVVAPRGRLLLVLAITVRDDRVAGYEVIADPDRLRQLDLAVLDDPPGHFTGR
jgi:RNA polymerase sigma factor (sigma-70 family)